MMKSRKGLLLLFIVQLILILSLGVSAAEAAPANENTFFTAEASASVVKEGDTFTVTVAIPENKGFALIMPKLTYNPALVTFDAAGSTTNSSFGTVTLQDSKDAPGSISITVGDFEDLKPILDGQKAPYTATGTVAVLKFKATPTQEYDEKGNAIEPLKVMPEADTAISFTLEGANNVIMADGTVGKEVKNASVDVKFVGKTHQHTVVVDAAVPATCTEDGLTEGSHCSYCEAVLTAQTVVKALDHNYGAWVSNGDKTHTKVCANDATHVVTENCAGGQATCEEKAVCEGCNTAYGEALGHTPSGEVTCTSAQVCTTCEKVLATKGHTPEVIPAVEPTYSSEGSTEGSRCAECGTILQEPGVIEAKSSTWIWITVIACVAIVGVVVAVIVVKKKSK
ncbi:MAG: hypothetical protein IJW49_09610 [Clostridia bacterium]|nr:hypothetical protein [Clostridia bacterium]